MASQPIHPGELIEPLILAPGGYSQSQLARQLGFNQPQPVNELTNGKRNITPKMALLLERLTQNMYPAEFWLLAQLRWDLCVARDALSPSRTGLVQPVSLSVGRGAELKGIDVEGLLRIASQLDAV